MPAARTTIGAVIACLILLLSGLGAPATRAQEASAPRLLLIASDLSHPTAQALAAYLADGFRVRLTSVSAADYRPLIDERIHDGFVYLGQDYFADPGTGLLADMSRTEKPLLWIGYHGWGLSAGRQAELGVTLADVQDQRLTQVNYRDLIRIGPTDTSQVSARYPARVLYWLFSDDLSVSAPGAVISKDFAYVSYLPSFAPDQPGAEAFDAAARAVLMGVHAGPQPLSAEERLAAARADRFRDGVHLPFALGDGEAPTIPYDDPSLHRRLLRIHETGAEWVTLSRTYFQNGIGGASITAHPAGTATQEALANIVGDAHDLGLFVRLSVVVNLLPDSARPGDWRGMIEPRDADAWWTAYGAILREAAVFARDNGIESLNIGAELSALQDEDARWRALITMLRDETGYRGLIGYQANYNAFTGIGWTDALDYLSVAAYWPLADSRDPPLETLTASWDRIGAQLDRYLEAHPGLDFELGEIGYTSQAYAALFPFSWKPDRAGKQNLDEQRNAYLALLGFLRGMPEIDGVSMFASTVFDDMPGDIGYSPFGKPAEPVMHEILNLR